MKPFRLLSVSLSVIAVLSACNLPAPDQTVKQNPTASGTPILQFNPTQPQVIISTSIAPAATVSPTPFPPNTPVWSIYTYTCEFSTGGSTMTMNLNWSDRSTSEEGYIVYRDGQVIATLVPDSTNYVDITFVAAGKTLRYFIEAFNQNWRASSSTITYGCQ